MSEIRIVYFSSVTENTKKFVEKLGFPAERIPLLKNDPPLFVDYPYILIVPTYGGGNLDKNGHLKPDGAVPKQVIKFLNDEKNRSLAKGVIASGNINFHYAYAVSGSILSNKLHIPHLYSFEIMGTPRDVINVQEGLKKFWTENNLTDI